MLYNLYYLCVDFMVSFASLTNTTYRDANMLILFGFVPLIIFTDTLLLIKVLKNNVMSSCI